MRMLTAIAVLVLLHGSIGSAETQSQKPPCNGDIAIVRVSTITRKGSIQGFMRAVDAHREWFRSHGFLDDDIYAARIIVKDKVTKMESYSNSEIMLFHVRPTPVDFHDAAWDAYVKQYRDNSDVKSEYYVCMPK